MLKKHKKTKKIKKVKKPLHNRIHFELPVYLLKKLNKAVKPAGHPTRASFLRFLVEDWVGA